MADSYAESAVGLLRQAARSGYRPLGRLRKDPDLEALRGREDFQGLLEGLEEKAKSGGG